VDLVANTLHVDDDQIRLLVDDSATEKRDHPAVGGRYSRQVRALRPGRLKPAPTSEGEAGFNPAGGIECR
jgi:hypothetical protein